MSKKNATVIGTAAVDVRELHGRKMMGLHYECGNSELPFGKVRFCQSICGSVFWMSVTDDKGSRLYALDTEDVMNAMLNVVAEHEEQSNA